MSGTTIIALIVFAVTVIGGTWAVCAFERRKLRKAIKGGTMSITNEITGGTVNEEAIRRIVREEIRKVFEERDAAESAEFTSAIIVDFYNDLVRYDKVQSFRNWLEASASRSVFVSSYPGAEGLISEVSGDLRNCELRKKIISSLEIYQPKPVQQRKENQ